MSFPAAQAFPGIQKTSHSTHGVCPSWFHSVSNSERCQEQLVSNKINFRTIRHQRGTTGTTMGSNSGALKKVQPSGELYLRSVPSFSSSQRKNPHQFSCSGTILSHVLFLLFCWPFVQWSMAKRLLDRANAGTIAAFSTCTNFPLHTKEQSRTRTHTQKGAYNVHPGRTEDGGRRTKAIARTWTWRVWSLALQGINLKKSHQSQSQEEDNDQKKKNWRWCPGKWCGVDALKLWVF